MQVGICHSIKASLLSYFGSRVEVDTMGERCAITLPLPTLDDRLMTVFVEPGKGDSFVVHDGGKTASELFTQGVHLTENKADVFRTMADRMGVRFSDETFRVGCKMDRLQSSIIAVAQCASVAMYELVQHKPVIEEETIFAKVSGSLQQWRPPYVKDIATNVEVQGAIATHKCNFVTHADKPHKTVAVNLIAYSGNAKAQAERYGFLALDLDKSGMYQSWSRLAIILKAEMWGMGNIQLVRKMASDSLAIRTGEEHMIQEIPELMTRLTG